MMKMAVALCLTLLGLSACGYGNTSDDSGTVSSFLETQDTSTAQDFSQDSFLVLGEFEIPTFDGNTLAPLGSMKFSRLDSILVLEKKYDPNLGNLIRLGLDREELESAVGERDFWIRERDLPLELLEQYVAPEGIEDSEEDIIAKRRMTYCYRFVKKYLISTGQVKTYLPGVSAYQAYSILPRYGFRKTGNSPSNAQNGEICVYSGGPQGHGHIEVKRNGKWWYGYGYKTNPISNRKFMACFVKG